VAFFFDGGGLHRAGWQFGEAATGVQNLNLIPAAPLGRPSPVDEPADSPGRPIAPILVFSSRDYDGDAWHLAPPRHEIPSTAPLAWHLGRLVLAVNEEFHIFGKRLLQATPSRSTAPLLVHHSPVSHPLIFYFQFPLKLDINA
jgi:hypothetical protein